MISYGKIRLILGCDQFDVGAEKLGMCTDETGEKLAVLLAQVSTFRYFDSKFAKFLACGG